VSPTILALEQSVVESMGLVCRKGRQGRRYQAKCIAEDGAAGLDDY